MISMRHDRKSSKFYTLNVGVKKYYNKNSKYIKKYIIKTQYIKI